MTTPEQLGMIAHLRGEVLSAGRAKRRPQRVVKSYIDGRPIVVKVYGHKHGWLRTSVRNAGQRLLAGATPATPTGRRNTEARLLELWRKHGFRVPDLLDIEFDLDQPYLVLEFIPGPRVRERLADACDDAAELTRRIAAFAAECGRRHQLALDLREPGLIHTRAGLRHLVDCGDVFAYIDFESAYTSQRNIEVRISAELAGWLRPLAADPNPRFLDAFVAAYPAPERLRRVKRDSRAGRSMPAWIRSLAGFVAPGDGVDVIP